MGGKREAVSETSPHMGGAIQGVSASTPNVGGKRDMGKTTKGVSETTLHAGEA